MCREILALPFALYEFWILGVCGDLRQKKRERVAQWKCPHCHRRFDFIESIGDMIVYYHPDGFCSRNRRGGWG